MSKVDSVTTTTSNTIVDNASAAVSSGRWSNLAIIASFLSSSLPSFLCGHSNGTTFPGGRGRSSQSSGILVGSFGSGVIEGVGAEFIQLAARSLIKWSLRSELNPLFSIV
jgi:hypothetical protein